MRLQLECSYGLASDDILDMNNDYNITIMKKLFAEYLHHNPKVVKN